MSIEYKAEQTWNTVYPDRRAWKDIGQSAQEEWIKVFTVYESISKLQSTACLDDISADAIHKYGMEF